MPSVKVKLAQWRWRLVVAALAVVAVRIAAAVALAALGDGRVADSGGRLALITALDALALALAGLSIAAFVLYGRIYQARVPTE